LKSANAIGWGHRLRALCLGGVLACAPALTLGQQPTPRPLPYAPLPPLLATVDASALSGDAAQILADLRQIADEVDHAATLPDQDRRLQEFLLRSLEFVRYQPDSVQVWALRAVAAVELNQSYVGRDAAKELARLRAGDSADPNIRGIFAMLDYKGWTRRSADAAQASAGSERGHNRVSLLTDSKIGAGKTDQVAFDPKWGTYDAYLHGMIAGIQQQWDRILAGSRTGPRPNTTVTVKFTLDYHGKVTGIVDVGSTSNDEGEQSCLTAITLAQPFGAWTGDMIASLGISQQLTFQFYYP
jgi:hypothetical protein